MRTTLVALIIGAVMCSAQVVTAQCCGSKSKAAKSSGDAVAEKATCGVDILAQLELTDEQSEKLAALKTECDASQCSVSGAKQYKEGLRAILTEEQLAKCETLCKEAGIDCGMTAKKAGSDDKS